MENTGKKSPRQRRSFTSEFKAEIVDLCQGGDRSLGQVARDFDLTETAGPILGHAGGSGGHWASPQSRAHQLEERRPRLCLRVGSCQSVRSLSHGRENSALSAQVGMQHSNVKQYATVQNYQSAIDNSCRRLTGG
jgi:hypothetical protein